MGWEEYGVNNTTTAIYRYLLESSQVLKPHEKA